LKTDPLAAVKLAFGCCKHEPPSCSTPGYLNPPWWYDNEAARGAVAKHYGSSITVQLRISNNDL